MDTNVLTIDRETLRQKLTRGDDIKLVNSLSEWDFKRKRIPGSLHFDTPEAMLSALRVDDEIVVYCSNLACRLSIAAYHLLVDHGYTRVRRYAEGLADWESAGLPLEGTWVDAAPPKSTDSA